MAEVTITDPEELEYRILYAIIVAGKSAEFTRRVVNRMFHRGKAQGETPFEVVRRHRAAGRLGEWLRTHKTGNYTKMEKAFGALVDLDIDLATCTPEELEVVPGIGRKTSRFFIIWTRADARVAALDVHILRWLKGLGYAAPKNTPGSAKKYAELEAAFIAEADKLGLSPQELDQQIWSAGAGEDWETQEQVK